MKKLTAVIVSFLMMCFAVIPCFAQSVTVPGDTEIDVYARYTENYDGVYSVTISGGKAEITLPDGTVITVSGLGDEAEKLFVMPILPSDTEAWAWFTECMKNYGTNILPFDIYLEDENGNRVQPSGEITITVTTPEKYGNPTVCYLATDGKVTVLDRTADKNTVSFKTNHMSYYVIAEKSGGTGTGTGDSPQTGDSSHMALWLTLLIISGGAVVLTAAKRFKIQKIE